ncbi:MAG: TetR/AcrR family transcriptional regulator [Gammaproteobacteria bacterium]|nr:TetR/AcrR family transcriptional regulator [Gammaproteobacteria bacterium]
MRYSPEYKSAANAKLIEAGGALAKKSGFSNTGMMAFANAAGVTTGAFYSQFGSKADFLYAIVDHELSRTIEAFKGKTGKELERTISWYLSPEHAAHPEHGCPIPSLGAEIGRADDATRKRFEELVGNLVSSIEAGTTDRAQAWALLAQSVGGMILARAVASQEAQEEILGAIQAVGMKNLVNHEKTA